MAYTDIQRFYFDRAVLPVLDDYYAEALANARCYDGKVRDEEKYVAWLGAWKRINGLISFCSEVCGMDVMQPQEYCAVGGEMEFHLATEEEMEKLATMDDGEDE